MKVVAIIQARMGSTRLPGKMMLPIADKPIIQYVVERAKSSQLINEVWVATTVSPQDDVLANWAQQNNILCYRGSGDDVLDRYYQTAKRAKAKAVVRLTGDCPLADPAVIDEVIREYAEGRNEYACNSQPPTFPDGLDTEVFSFASLEKAWSEAKLLSDREHVTPYIWKHPELFKIKNVIHVPNLSAERWTLDTPEDFMFLRLIMEECARRGVNGNLNEVLEILAAHPKWRALNSNQRRNEGYAKSLAADVSL